MSACHDSRYTQAAPLRRPPWLTAATDESSVRSHGTMPLDRPLVPGDQAALGPHPVPGDADAAGELRQLGDVGVALVDAFEAVLGRIEQVAARHLRVRRAGVEQRRARREVGERRHQVVELDRRIDVTGAVGFGAEAAGDPQEEVLRGLDDLPPLRMAQQVAVVHGAQAEELERAVAIGVDRRVERGCVRLDEGEHVVGHQAFGMADLDRLGEPRDVLVADFLVDDRGEQARGELGVGRFLDDEPGGGTDRQVVELPGARAVGERRDGAGGDAHRVDAEQAFRRPGDGIDDLVDVDRLERPAALADPHAARTRRCRCRRGRRFRRVGEVGAAGAAAARSRRVRVRGSCRRSCPCPDPQRCRRSVSPDAPSRSSVVCRAVNFVCVRLRFRGCETPHVVVHPGPDPHISWVTGS